MLKTLEEMQIRRVPQEDLQHVLEHAAQAWQALRGARIFITGGTGFVGLWLLESIAGANARLDAGIRATVLSRSPASFRAKAAALAAQPCFEWLEGDVRDFEFPAGTWTHVLHAAASSEEASAPDYARRTHDTIVNGTKHLLDFARGCGARDLLYVSSGSVCGPQPSELACLPEDHPGKPDPASRTAAYDEGKLAAERLCMEAAGDRLATKIARCFALVGPHLPLDAHFAIGNFLRDAANGSPVVVQGDGLPIRTYLYAADLVAWLLTVLVRGRSARVYNVGSDEAISLGELAHRIATLGGTQAEIRGRATGGRVGRYIPCIDRARGELGLQVRIGLDEALRRTYRWVQAA
jgi:nucleoside-diphosphate-sugar epimerase